MTGRPTIRTDAIIESILDQHGDGVPLMQICRQEGMPKLRTVYTWLDEDTDLAARFARARKAAIDNIAMDAVDIADDGRRDYTEDKDGRVVVDHDHIARAKLRVDTRLKLLSCWDAGRYGTKTQVEHSGKLSLESLVADPDQPE